MNKIALIGVIPPPIGGRSIYFKKTINKLLNIHPDLNIDAYILNKNTNEKVFSNQNQNLKVILNYRSLPVNILLKKYKIVHTNDENFKVLSLISFLCYLTNTKVFLNLHSFRSNPENYSLINKICMRISFYFLDKIFIVGKNEYNKLIQYISLKKVEQISPHIRVHEDHKDFLNTNYDIENLGIFINENHEEFNIKKSDFVLTWNGSISENEINDPYGLELFLEMIIKIEAENQNAKNFKYIIVVIGLSEKENEKLSTLESQIKKYKLEKKILLVTQTISFNEILSHTSVYIRPTRTDSYGLSVIESLDFGVPTIASNVCERPKSVILFNDGDLNNLLEKVEYVFLNYEKQIIDIKKNAQDIENDFIEQTYNKILNKS